MNGLASSSSKKFVQELEMEIHNQLKSTQSTFASFDLVEWRSSDLQKTSSKTDASQGGLYDLQLSTNDVLISNSNPDLLPSHHLLLFPFIAFTASFMAFSFFLIPFLSFFLSVCFPVQRIIDRFSHWADYSPESFRHEPIRRNAEWDGSFFLKILRVPIHD